MVHLKQPGSYLLVQQNVQAKNLEAHGVFNVIRLASAVGLCQGRLTRETRFYGNVFDLVHQLFPGKTLFILL